MLKGKVALVTGGSRGIGKAIVLKLAEQGADVAFTCQSLGENSENVTKLIEAQGVKALAIASNAASFDDAHKVVEEVVAKLGKVDILVNNAGITKDTLMMRMSEEAWDAVINVNLKSAFNYIHATTPLFVKQRSGSIINMSSVVGLSGNAGQANYAASKAGIVGLTKSIAQELGARSVRANVIAPGFIETDMTEKLSEEMKKEWANTIPLKRGGQPEDVANCVLFLASDLSSYITGQVISVCGGMKM